MSKSLGKSLFLTTVIVISLLISSCGIYRQTREFEHFVHSRFAVKNLQMLSIAGIDVLQKQSVTDFDLTSIVLLGKRFFTQQLPSRMQINIEAANPFDEKAAIAGMDWLLMMKQDTLARGKVNQAVQIPAHGRAVFPLTVTFNLAQLIHTGSLDSILRLMLNKSNRKETLKQSGVRLKIRPYYLRGNKVRKYPAFLSMKLN